MARGGDWIGGGGGDEEGDDSGREREVVGLLWAWMGFGWESVGLLMGLYGPGTFGMDHCEGSYFFSFFFTISNKTYTYTLCKKKKKKKTTSSDVVSRSWFLMGRAIKNVTIIHRVL